MADPNPAFQPYDWIPETESETLDLSELLVVEEFLIDEWEEIERIVDAHLAIYKRDTLAKPEGLCTTFKYADLNASSFQLLQKFEQKLDGRILVAYAKPLQRW